MLAAPTGHYQWEYRQDQYANIVDLNSFVKYMNDIRFDERATL